MQAKLFEMPSDATRVANGFRDSAFTKNKELPLHRWVPCVAGFSAHFVEDCIDWYMPMTKRREDVWVLDPFAGVGTTLVEAYLHSLNVIGFEINPYAVSFIAEASSEKDFNCSKRCLRLCDDSARTNLGRHV